MFPFGKSAPSPGGPGFRAPRVYLTSCTSPPHIAFVIIEQEERENWPAAPGFAGFIWL